MVHKIFMWLLHILRIQLSVTQSKHFVFSLLWKVKVTDK